MEGSGWRSSSGAAGAKGLGQEQLAQLLSGLPAPPGSPWFFFRQVRSLLLGCQHSCSRLPAGLTLAVLSWQTRSPETQAGSLLLRMGLGLWPTLVVGSEPLPPSGYFHPCPPRKSPALGHLLRSLLPFLISDLVPACACPPSPRAGRLVQGWAGQQTPSLLPPPGTQMHNPGVS